MLELDTHSTYYDVRRGSGSFVTDFVKVSYKVGENVYTTTVSDVTPREIADTWVFEINQDIRQAEEISLLINIRGQLYVMKVK